MNLIREFFHRPVNVLKVKWKHRKTLDAFEKQIAEARAKHRAVRHLEQARSDYMHACLSKDAKRLTAEVLRMEGGRG